MVGLRVYVGTVARALNSMSLSGSIQDTAVEVLTQSMVKTAFDIQATELRRVGVLSRRFIISD